LTQGVAMLRGGTEAGGAFDDMNTKYNPAAD
jgi:hypothetical protein